MESGFRKPFLAGIPSHHSTTSQASESAQYPAMTGDSLPEATASAGDCVETRSYWRCAKSDFFPEPSFRSWTAYRSALLRTGPRLRDRLLHRSSDADEVDVLRRRSENSMRRCLTWWDLAWLGFGSVVGTGIFVLTGQEARLNAGPSIVLSYAASGLSALLSVLCYTEFAVEIPSAGGSFSYLRVELGDTAAYLAAANILLEALVGAAGLARSWTSYFATLIGRDPDALRIQVPSLAEGFDLLDPIAVVVLIFCLLKQYESSRVQKEGKKKEEQKFRIENFFYSPCSYYSRTDAYI